jgi:hypothetical protein
MIKRFDTIILAVGFGLEIQPPKFPLNSYWRNEIYGQPILNGTQQPYMVSGFGEAEVTMPARHQRGSGRSCVLREGCRLYRSAA